MTRLERSARVIAAPAEQPAARLALAVHLGDPDAQQRLELRGVAEGISHGPLGLDRHRDHEPPLDLDAHHLALGTPTRVELDEALDCRFITCAKTADGDAVCVLRGFHDYLLVMKRAACSFRDMTRISRFGNKRNMKFCRS
jgi:hypothetical protein